MTEIFATAVQPGVRVITPSAQTTQPHHLLPQRRSHRLKTFTEVMVMATNGLLGVLPPLPASTTSIKSMIMTLPKNGKLFQTHRPNNRDGLRHPRHPGVSGRHNLELNIHHFVIQHLQELVVVVVQELRPCRPPLAEVKA